MNYFDPDVVRKADSIAAERYGITGTILMENAGRSVCDALLSSYPKCRSACILCGPGNNGGDGFVVARHLDLHGVSVRVFTSCSKDSFQGDASYHRDILSRLGIDIRESAGLSDQDIQTEMIQSDVCVDSLLGTGSSGAPRGEIARLIRLSGVARHILSVDIPSGIDPRTGDVFDPCIRAEITVSLLAAKSGLAVLPAREAAGRVVIGSIGIEERKVLRGFPRIVEATQEIFVSRFPDTGPECHKYKKGSVLVVSGSDEYPGAPLLCVGGALRSGAGVVRLVSPEASARACVSLYPEAICVKAAPDMEAPDLFRKSSAALRAIVCGPGIGRSDWGRRWTETVWEQRGVPTVFDGDSLFWLSVAFESVMRRPDVLLTPHDGEAARLLGISVDDVRRDRLGAARRISERYGPVLLKGWTTIVDDGTRTAVVSRGSAVLAVAGSGDVLSGCAGSMLAFGMTPYEAGCAASWIHGESGANWARRNGQLGMLAREIAEGIPGVLSELSTRWDNPCAVVG